MKKVDFFIAGNLRSGSTYLYGVLKQHPDIFLPDYKELKYFCTDFHKSSDKYHGKKVHYPVRTLKDYQKFYKKADENKLWGEATPHYAYSKEAAKNIYKYNPGAKIIFIIREPISFLKSLHQNSLNSNNETEVNLIKALKLEGDRKRGKFLGKKISCPEYFYYSDWIKYDEQIDRYLKLFGLKNIKVILFDDLIKNTDKAYRNVLKFLSLDYKKVNFDINSNSGGMMRLSRISRLLRHSFLWRLAVKYLPSNLYAQGERLLSKLFLIKTKNQTKEMDNIDNKEITKLKNKYKKRVDKISIYLNRKNIIRKDLVKLWGYDKV